MFHLFKFFLDYFSNEEFAPKSLTERKMDLSYSF